MVRRGLAGRIASAKGGIWPTAFPGLGSHRNPKLIFLTGVASIMRLPVFLLFFATAAFGQDLSENSIGVAFRRFDSNSDGELTVAEMIAAGRKTSWIGLADTDKNGSVNKTEAVAFFDRKKQEGDSVFEPTEIIHEIPGNSPVRLEGLRKAAEYSAGQNGHSFLVAVDGKVIYERYDGGWKSDQSHRLASGTKSFSAALLAAAVKDGLLSSIDEPVADAIEEWRENETLKVITYRNLLDLSSGLEPGGVGRVPDYSVVHSMKSLSPPGEKFRYGPNAFQVFGEALRRKLQARPEFEFEDPLAYLEARVFDPIGLHYGAWRRDEGGMPHLPSGAFLTAAEWWKYGEFIRLGGSWGGKELVDTATLQECVRPSRTNPSYGITFWMLNNRNGEPATGEGGYMAAGAGKQRLYILPEKKMVIVRQGESRKLENTRLLSFLFSKK